MIFSVVIKEVIKWHDFHHRQSTMFERLEHSWYGRDEEGNNTTDQTESGSNAIGFISFERSVQLATDLPESRDTISAKGTRAPQ